jgi:hypothetical protein
MLYVQGDRVSSRRVSFLVYCGSGMALQAELCHVSTMGKKSSYRTFPYGSTQTLKQALECARMVIGALSRQDDRLYDHFRRLSGSLEVSGYQSCLLVRTRKEVD